MAGQFVVIGRKDGASQHARWSPDGTAVFLLRFVPGKNVWLIDRDGTHDTNLTGNTDRNVSVNFLCRSPNGRQPAYLLSTASG